MGELKTSVHWGLNGDGLGECLKAGVTSVKYCGAFPRNEPVGNALIIGRTFREDGFAQFVGDPGLAALSYVRASLDPVIKANPHVGYWESPNEPVWSWDDADAGQNMRWYATFLRRVAQELAARDKGAVIGNWSVGNPPYFLWQYAEDMLQATVELSRCYIGRHAYGPLYNDYAFRHRNDGRFFAQMGFPNVKFLLTECGAENTGGMKPWRRQWGTFDEYWEKWIRPFEISIRSDRAVIGAHLFTLGLTNDPAWNDYQLPGRELAKKMQALSSELGDLPTTKEIIMDQFPDLKFFPLIIPSVDNGGVGFAKLAYVMMQAYNEYQKTGRVGDYLPFGVLPAPQPTLTMPKLDATNKRIINEIYKLDPTFGLIPSAIFREMTPDPLPRPILYDSLVSKLPLEQWGLGADFDRVVAAFKAAGIL